MGVAEIVAGLTVVEKSCDGVRMAYDLPPDGEPTPLPCFLNLVGDGDIKTPRHQGMREWTHRVQAIALVAYEGRLADAERVSRALIPEFVAKLDDNSAAGGYAKTLGRLSGVLSADVVRYRKDNVIIGVGEGARAYVGIIFDVEVREMEENVNYG